MTHSRVWRRRAGGRITGITAAVLAAGCALAPVTPAFASGVVYAAVAATGAGNCADPADACSLSTALSQVAGGGTVQLVTPGSTARYVGNWAVGGVTIEAAPGLPSAPILDGDGPDAPSGETCSTSSCAGPVLTSDGGLSINGITIADGYNTNAGGGAIYINNNKEGASLTVTGSTFSGNTAADGGAIYINDYEQDAPMTVTGSTFSGNTATDGGAIDIGGDLSDDSSLTVTRSTFSGNTATDGGAIDSGNDGYGGSMTVTASTFSGNTATDGGAIDIGDRGSGSVTASTFSGNSATHGGAIDAEYVGYQGGFVTLTANVFTDSCNPQGLGSGGGYNVGSDATCLSSAAGDYDAGSVSALRLGTLADNGGPTQTILPQPGSPVLGVIPNPTIVGNPGISLCPATDQRGDTSAPGPCDAGAVQVSEPLGTTMTVSSSVNPSMLGQSVTFTSTVAATDSVSPFDGGGMVTFSAGGNPISGCPAQPLTLVAGSYQATCTTSSLSVGSLVVSAAYGGDTNYGGSSGSVTQTVQAATSTTVSASPDAPSYGSPVTLTATVSPADGSGTVSFTADGNPVPGCSAQPLSLVSGSYQATCTTSSLAVGSHGIAAAYSGDTSYVPSSGTGSVKVTQATPGDAVTDSGPVTLGSPVTFTATVSGPADAATPTGSITWQVSGSAGATACIGSTTTLSAGTATCTIDATRAGTYAVSDSYQGDGNYASATSGADTVTVTPVSTSTALSSSASPSTYGQSVTFTATITPTDGGGTVTFTADGKTLAGCSAQPLSLVSGSYRATCTTSALAGGSHVVEAAYTGDTNYSGSSTTITQAVSQKPTGTSLKSSVSPSTYGQAVTFTAIVSPADGGGTVSFSRGTGKAKTAICPSQSLSRVNGSYQASCTVSTLPAGTDTITTSYSGDTDYGRSSATVSQMVNKAPTTTSVTSSKNPSRHGQSVTFTAIVSPTDGSGTVTFWHSGNTITGCTSVPLKDNTRTYKAACTTSSLPAGTDKIKAVYSGDKNCFGSTGTVSQVVTKTAITSTFKAEGQRR